MQTARLCIQCLTPDQSAIGTFLFYGDKGQPYRDCQLASPVFSDSVALYQWAKANCWALRPYDPDWPVGIYGRV